MTTWGSPAERSSRFSPPSHFQYPAHFPSRFPFLVMEKPAKKLSGSEGRKKRAQREQTIQELAQAARAAAALVAAADKEFKKHQQGAVRAKKYRERRKARLLAGEKRDNCTVPCRCHPRGFLSALQSPTMRPVRLPSLVVTTMRLAGRPTPLSPRSAQSSCGGGLPQARAPRPRWLPGLRGPRGLRAGARHRRAQHVGVLVAAPRGRPAEVHGARALAGRARGARRAAHLHLLPVGQGEGRSRRPAGVSCVADLPARCPRRRTLHGPRGSQTSRRAKS